MEVSRISSKGQVTIPKTIRNLLELSEKDNVAFIYENGKVMIIKATLSSIYELKDHLAPAPDPSK